MASVSVGPDKTLVHGYYRSTTDVLLVYYRSTTGVARMYYRCSTDVEPV
jgi:hypothetical protein